MPLLQPNMPDPLNTRDWEAWEDSCEAAALLACPLSRSSQVYIELDTVNGGTSVGSGTAAAPWLVSTWNDLCVRMSSEIAADTEYILGEGIYRGTSLAGLHQLTINQANVTVRAADNETVIVNGFQYEVALGATWTANGAAFYATIPSGQNAYAFRRRGREIDDGYQYRELSSIADVQATVGSFYHDSDANRIYMRPAQGETPGDFAWEYVDGDEHGANVGTVHAGILVDNVGGCRVRGIRVDGFGYGPDEGDQRYGIKVLVSGDQIVVVDNCESYFNPLHNMGGNEGPGSGRGGAVFLNCRGGYMRHQSSGTTTSFVHYHGDGDHQTIVRSYTCVAGNIPDYTGEVVPQGRAMFTHSAGGGLNSAFAVFRDCTVASNEFEVYDIGGHADVPAAATRTDLRGFVWGCRDLRSAKGTGTSYANNPAGTAWVNNHFRIRVPDVTQLAPGSASGYVINQIEEYDGTDLTGQFAPLNADSGSDSAVKFYHCHIRAYNVPDLPGNTAFGLIERDAITATNNSFLARLKHEAYNCVFSVESGHDSAFNYVAHGNDAGQTGVIDSNAYFNVRNNRNNRGTYTRDANAVELAEAPAVAVKSEVLDGLGTANAGVTHDINGNPYGAAPSIGPVGTGGGRALHQRPWFRHRTGRRS